MFLSVSCCVHLADVVSVCVCVCVCDLLSAQSSGL